MTVLCDTTRSITPMFQPRQRISPHWSGPVCLSGSICVISGIISDQIARIAATLFAERPITRVLRARETGWPPSALFAQLHALREQAHGHYFYRRFYSAVARVERALVTREHLRFVTFHNLQQSWPLTQAASMIPAGYSVTNHFADTVVNNELEWDDVNVENFENQK